MTVTPAPNLQEKYFDENGRPTLAGLRYFQEIARQLQDALDRLDAAGH